MKQLFIYIVIILLLSSASLYAGVNDSGISNNLKLIPLTVQERTWLNTHPNILLGAPTTYPPFVIKKNDHTNTGMLIDLIDVINQRLDTNIRLHIEDSWFSIQEKAKVRSIDGLAIASKDSKREPFFNPTEILFSSYFYIFARSKNEFKIKEMKDLSGMRIGYKRAAVAIKSLIEQYPGIIPVPYEDNEAISKALLNREIDVLIGWVSFDNWRRDVLQGTIDNVLIIVDHPTNMVMHIRKDWPELVQILNKAIEAIQLDGLPQIMDKWFIQQPSPALKPKVQLSTEEQAWLKAHSIIRYGYDPSWAPVEYTDENGIHRGISAAYMKAVANRLNIKIEPVSNLTWDQSVELLGKSMLDLLPATTSTAERLNSMAFTQPYISLPIAIFSGDNIPYIGDIANLYGRKVAVPNNYAIYEWLKQDHPQLSIIPVENIEQGLNLVNNKQAYAFIGNLLTTSHYIAKTGKLNIRVVGDTSYRNDLAVAVRSDWPIFTGILQKTLDSIPQSQKDAIHHEWISVRYEKSFDYSFLWKLITAVVLLFFIFSLWNWRLGKEIKQRKLTETKLKKAKEYAEQANKAKSRFISSMSHELRTPLNAVIGYSQLLQLDGMSREAIKEYSLETLNAGKHLLDLISDILDLAHIESDLVDINIEAVDIIAVLITSISLVESLTKDNNISLLLSLKDSQHTNAYALVDKVRLKQVILNLLSNAIKYNNENGSVTVSIEDSDAKNLTVKITDTGRGLSEDDISLLYEPFNRLGAENSNIQGTGIGLTITRQLVEKMNGSISVDSSPGAGTTFSINLLRAPSSSGTENHKAIEINMEDIGDSTMKILYVEDTISNQKLLKAIMDTRADISLTTVSSAESAIDLIKKNNPDLILLDIDLPGMNGYEFFEYIQSIESYKSIPVIAITAKAMLDDIEKAKKYDFAAYLTKPIIINKLFNAIEPFTK